MKKGCMTTLVTITILIVIFFLVWLLSAPRYVSTKNAGGFPRLDNIDLKVKNYRWRREWRWSGIFPIYGGFMTDPHFGGTEPKTFTSDIQKVLNSSGARYQGIDINPWFDKNLSRSLIAIEVNDKIYEYDVAILEKLDYGFTNSHSQIYAFLYKDNMYVYTVVDINHPIIITISLPLESGKDAKTIYLDTNSGQKLLNDLKNNHQDLPLSLKSYLCEKARAKTASRICNRIWATQNQKGQTRLISKTRGSDRKSDE